MNDFTKQPLTQAQMADALVAKLCPDLSGMTYVVELSRGGRVAYPWADVADIYTDDGGSLHIVDTDGCRAAFAIGQWVRFYTQEAK